MNRIDIYSAWIGGDRSGRADVEENPGRYFRETVLHHVGGRSCVPGESGCRAQVLRRPNREVVVGYGVGLGVNIAPLGA